MTDFAPSPDQLPPGREAGRFGSLRQAVTVVSVSFLLVHLICLGVFFTPFSWKLALLCGVLYGVRMFAVTAGYHRYFSHRSYAMNRFNQFLLAFLAQTTAQKGVLWWAAHHRTHHRYSDTPRDLHSPVVNSFWWSHVGWVLSSAYDRYDPNSIKDFGRFPELRFLDRYHWLCPWAFGSAVFLFGLATDLGGWPALLWGFFVSTVLLFHATFCINSLAHVWGTRRFATPDQSRNNFLLALVTFGEGWHNNHHHCQSACRQGLRWWELDLTYYCLRAMAVVGLVRGLKAPVREAQAPTLD